MSEAAPGYPDAPEFATAPRARLAEAVRVLIEAVMTTPEATEDDMAAATEAAEQATAALTHRDPGRRSGPGYLPSSPADHLPRSPVVGEASPLSPRVQWEVIDGVVHARGVFGAAYEGPPGYVHGGMIALAFDEILGLANFAAGAPGMTGTLTIRYRRPTPLFTELAFTGRVDRVEGRRVLTKGELRAGDALCAEAEGIFVKPRLEWALEHFGRGPEGYEPGTG